MDAEKIAPEAALSLSLGRVAFPEAMRLVLAHGRNGVAHLTNGDKNGEVHIHDGAVIHAAIGDEKGSEAFYELALWKSGRLDFREKDTGREKTILTSTRSLLVEASRRSEAWSSISNKVKNFEQVPNWARLTSDSIRLTGSDWAFLRLVDGRRTIRQIVDELKSDIFVAGRVVHGLLTVGVLRLDDAPEERDESLDLVPRRDDSSISSDPFELTAQEWDLLSRVDGARTLGAIAEASNLSPEALLKTVKGLKERGFLQLGSRDSKKRKGP